MSFPFALLVGPLTSLIERIFPDKAEQDKAKAEMMSILAESQAKEMEAKSKVLVAEAQGESWLQRNWRPMTMLIFNIIIAFNFIFSPVMGMFGIVVPYLPIPGDMWFLLSVGIGGYIASRGYEKGQRMKLTKAQYEAIREEYGHIPQSLVDKLEK